MQVILSEENELRINCEINSKRDTYLYVSFSIDVVVSLVQEVMMPFSLSRELMAATRCQEPKCIISGTIESDNHADTW